MNFSEIVEVFEKFVSTNQRKLLTEYTSNFLKKIEEPQDLQYSIYLLQGNVFPERSNDTIGVGESLLIDTLSEYTGYSINYIKNILVEKGDLGESAEILINNPRQQRLFNTPSVLEIELLVHTIRSIAHIHGDKANEKKKRTIHSLLGKCNAKDSKYLIKIILGNLRLGVSTHTILDALANVFGKEPKDKIRIERTYMFNPDLGKVAFQLKENGVEEFVEPAVTYDSPIKMMLAQRVDYDKIIKEHDGMTYCEWKLDGERAQIHKTRDGVVIYSRELNDITEQYPDLVEEIMKVFKKQSCVVEGEIVAVENGKFMPFQHLMKRKRKKNIEEIAKEVPVKLYLFDILKHVDKDYTNAPYHLRRHVLGQLFQDSGMIKLVPNQECHILQQVIDFFEEAKEQGLEGIIAKKRGGVYSPGKRSKDWIKMKAYEGGRADDTIDVVIIGGFHGRGRRRNTAGSFLCAVYDKERDKLVAFTNIGSGFTDEQIVKITKLANENVMVAAPPNVETQVEPDLWVLPSIVLEIMVDEIQLRENVAYVPRFPVFKRLRPDKGPRDCTTLQEIQEMYNRQKVKL